MSTVESDTVPVSRVRLQQLEADRTLDAGRRRIIARALRAQGHTFREIGRLTKVSATQAFNDLKS